MKIALVYATMTGHSRKIAESAAAALGVKAVDVKSGDAPQDADLLLLVGGIYGGKPAPELLEYAGTLGGDRVKRAVLMMSSVSRSARQRDLREALAGRGVPVAEEEFKCRGNFLFLGLGHPNQADLAAAGDFARRALMAAEKAGETIPAH